MWNYNDSEFNYVVMINGTNNTGMLIANNISEESAKECFDRLEIKSKRIKYDIFFGFCNQ